MNREKAVTGDGLRCLLAMLMGCNIVRPDATLWLQGMFMFGLGTTELLVIFLIVVLLFGAGKIPQLGAGLAKGIKNFRNTMSDDEPAKDVKTADSDDTVAKKD